ncbi:MAG TPA: glycosyltransferase [Planctomycetes bacterium]|nr:glycosyltransferase [Planctomycetota bacterium]
MQQPAEDFRTDRLISIVIPVFNGADSIGHVVERVRATFHNQQFEIVLVNDASHDDSEQVCQELVERFSESVVLVQLSRNFGEHNAVLAGLRLSHGDYVAVMDDDAPNPPEEIPRMLAALEEKNLDVVYGRYVGRKHSLGRRVGSWLNDRMATIMLRKPPDLYLSSFKIMNRFIVDQISRYGGPFPYIDGLIFRASTRVDQIDVKHDERLSGASNYTLRRLIRLWLNMFLGFSIIPLRASVVLGFCASFLSFLGIVAIVVDKIWVNPQLTVGIPTVLACIVFFSGVQLIVLGAVGEYVGRIFLDGSGMPQSVVRYVRRGGQDDE